MLELESQWIWDFWLVENEGLWHAYYLKAEKSLNDPELRHWNVSQGHAVSTDLKNWEHKGTVLQPTDEPSWDDKTTWTGSVVQGKDGLWHYFYTGTSQADGGKKQRIGHMVGETLDEFERVDDGLCLDLNSDPRYEDYQPDQWHDRAFRDPWVMKDPAGEGWIMYFTARVPNIAEPNAGGAIGFARSDDLYKWQLEAPVFSGCFGQLEVPQVLEINNKWYCVFCTLAEHWSEAYKVSNPQSPVTGSHYLIADSHLGPWQVAPGPFLDGDIPPNRYAGKIIQYQGSWHIIGFLHDDRDGNFIGKGSIPHRIELDDNGLFVPIKIFDGLI